jgi:ribosomal protein S18 acetylase RimI-like enzyme
VSTQLRPARAEDLPQVVALIRALADFEKLVGPDAAAERRFAEDFTADPPRFRLLVAESDGALVAYALYFFTYSTFLAQPSLYLEDLFVRPDCRSRGIGRSLMVELARIAVAEKCGRFEWTVLSWNARAQEFYRGLGATLLTDWQVCRVDGQTLLTLGQSAV